LTCVHPERLPPAKFPFTSQFCPWLGVGQVTTCGVLVGPAVGWSRFGFVARGVGLTLTRGVLVGTGVLVGVTVGVRVAVGVKVTVAVGEAVTSIVLVA
jgi:hypothetical protein